MKTEFGYDEREPNVPWYMRDQLNKCEHCGKTWVGILSCLCVDCANAVCLDAAGAIVYEGDGT